VEIYREEKGELCGFSTIDKSVLAFYHPRSSSSSSTSSSSSIQAVSFTCPSTSSRASSPSTHFSGQNSGVLIVFSSTETTERTEETREGEREGEGQGFRVYTMKNLGHFNSLQTQGQTTF
jgi:hypothetical protein